MIRYESVITALIGGVFGLVIGVVGGGARSRRSRCRAPATCSPSRSGTLVILLFVAALAGLLAAQLPARRAARLDMLAGARQRVAPRASPRPGARRAAAKLARRGSAPSRHRRRPRPTPSSQATAWDLEPLVDGEGERGRRAAPGARRSSARDAFAERYAGRARRARPRRPRARRCGELGRDPRARRRAPATTRRCASPPTRPTRPRGALLQRVQEQETAIQTTLLFFELEWAALPRRARRGAARRRGPRLLPPPPAQRAPLPRPPALRARGEDPRREVAHRRERVDAAVRGADLGDRGASCRTQAPASGERVALDVALSRLSLPDRELRRSTAEAVTAALAPGLRTRAFLFNTLLADKATDDRLRQLPALAGGAQPRQRGERRVRAGAGRGGPRRAMRSPRRWYRLKARLLGVERLADYDRMASVSRGRGHASPSPQAREIVLDCYRSFSPELGELAAALLRRAPHRRAGAPGQARRRVLRLRRARRCSRTCCSTTPRAAATCSRSRTSSATACTSRSPPGRAIFHQHTPLTLAETASVFGETIVFGRLLERGHARPPRGSRCSPRTSRTRSRPSSARSR